VFIHTLTADLHTPDLRVIIISGKTFSQSRERCVQKHTLTLSLSAARGPVFSSGHDLGELTSAWGREHHIKVFQTCSEVRGHLLYTRCLKNLNLTCWNVSPGKALKTAKFMRSAWKVF